MPRRWRRQAEEGTKKEESFEAELCKDKDAGEWFRLVAGEGDNCRDVIQCTSSVSLGREKQGTAAPILPSTGTRNAPAQREDDEAASIRRGGLLHLVTDRSRSNRRAPAHTKGEGGRLVRALGLSGLDHGLDHQHVAQEADLFTAPPSPRRPASAVAGSAGPGAPWR